MVNVKAKFLIESWNQFHRVADYLPRTSNQMEGWHHAFASSFSGDHVAPYTLMEAIKREITRSDREISQYNQGAVRNLLLENHYLINITKNSDARRSKDLVPKS